MSDPELLDLGLGILDHQLVDSEGRRCGKVDDLELASVREGSPGLSRSSRARPCGAAVAGCGRLASLLARGRTVRVPWEEVEKIDSAVHLRKTARELRLGRGDDRARRWVEWLPGS